MHQFRSGREVKDYYTAALQGGDYYTAEEQNGRWCGELGKRLGLDATVTRDEFAKLAENLHPRTGESLTPRTDDDRTVGYDINFHVPKGVSVLHLVSKDGRILDAIRDSANETMRELEAQTRTRVRTDGKQDERATGELVWGEFLHTTTRPIDGVPDPHLHVHCFAFNATYDQDEKRMKAAQFRDIKRDMPYHEAAFYSRLAWRLERLGYEVERKGKEWDVAGIPSSAKKKFSRRTEAIEDLAKKLGVTDPSRKAGLGARSRSRKQGKLTPEQLRSQWLKRMTPEELRAVEQVARGTGLNRPIPIDELSAARKGLDHAISDRFERESIIAEPRLLETALRVGLGKFRPETLRSLAQKDPELLRRQEGTLSIVTTREVLHEERSMLAFAREGRGTCQALEAKEPWTRGLTGLNRQQTRALEHLMTSKDRVMLLRGGAGTGKTTLLREAWREMKSRGHAITVLAPTAEASRGVLRKAGFAEADTVSKFLADPQLQKEARGRVWWIDEAGLIGTPTMAKVFSLAESLKARVILCGDSKQHAPIERGDALRLLETRVGLLPAELTEVVRQQGIYKEASEALSDGKFAKGIDALDRLKAIREVGNRDWVPMVEDYLDLTRRGRTPLVVAPTHAEGDDITSLIRAALRSDGRIGQEERSVPQLRDLGWTAAKRSDPADYEAGQVIQFQRAVGSGRNGFKPGDRLVVTGRDADGRIRVTDKAGKDRVLPLERAASFSVNEQRFIGISPGDAVRATSGGRTADGKHRVNNGSVYRVEGFTQDGNLRLDNGWEVSPDFGRFAHGYVSTSYAAQGRTVDWVLIAQGRSAGAAASAAQVYVSVTRGREGVRIYTDDRQAIVDALGKLNTRRSADELMSGTTASDRSRQHAATMVRLKWYENDRAQRAERTRSRTQSRARGRERGYER